MRIEWKPAIGLCGIHAAVSVHLGLTLVDATLHAPVDALVKQLNERLSTVDLETGVFWKSLASMVAENEKIRDGELAEDALQAAGCSEFAIDSMAPAVATMLVDLRDVFQQKFPKLHEQLQLRSGPLRSQVESFAPGLQHQIAGHTIPIAKPNRLTVWMVHPACGGGGDVPASSETSLNNASNRKLKFWFETVLTNINLQLPETLRFAYLTTLAALADMENRWVPSPRLRPLLRWALVPVVLSAGQQLDLITTPIDAPMIADAIKLWNGGTPQALAANSNAALLQSWWDQATENQMPWPVAIKALDHMLGSNQVAQ